jgi:[Skp1-protein]-hydroxyproline N-acetylglucosaminyltransferase
VDGASGEGEDCGGRATPAGRASSSHGSSASSESGAVPPAASGVTSCVPPKSTAIKVFSPELRPSPLPAALKVVSTPKKASGSAKAAGSASSSSEEDSASCASAVAMHLHEGHLTELAMAPSRPQPRVASTSLDKYGEDKAAHRRSVSNDKIFVSVVAYRDKECPATIVDLFRKAADPGRVFVGLYTQCDPETDGDCLLESIAGSPNGVPKEFENNIREVRQHWREARGPCWARHLAQKLASDEAYYFQIDSHMRFLQDWDDILIKQLQACCAPNPVLSTYPAGYERGGPTPDQAPCTMLCASSFGNDGMLRIKGRMLRRQQTNAPIPALFWAAGYSFSYSTMLRDVPYDPGLKFLFFGEEMSMLARLWTSGYDVFAPSETVVFHLWSRDYRPSFSADVPDYYNLRRRSLARVEVLLGGASSSQADSAAVDGEKESKTPRHEWSATAHINCCTLHAMLSERMRNPFRHDEAEAASPPCADDAGEIGQRFGLGAQRTLADFLEHCGVDFAAKAISEKAENGGMPLAAFLM